VNRRDFIKVSLVSGLSLLIPSFTYAKKLDLSKINFSKPSYNAQTIIIYMYGGASQLAGNITNIKEINKHSYSDYYSYFRNITPTQNGFWKEAGGDELETMLSNGDMTIYRCCYSKVREEEGNKAHGICTEQNQIAVFNTNSAGGIVSNLANILNENGVISSSSFMPFITMEGESKFYEDGALKIPSYLRAVAIDENFSNPYERSSWSVRNWTYYTKEEREHKNYNRSDEEGGFNPALVLKLDTLASKHNSNKKIKEAFSKRENLATFIKEIKEAQTPDLGEDSYPKDNTFAKKLESAINILNKSSDTKVITLGTGGLGGWDDHNDAKDYVQRSKNLFRALRSAIAHLKAIDKIDNVNIMLFAEFGRNVNLNSANGWDHGNLQNFYIFGGKGYLNHKGVVGETIVDSSKRNRLWLKPKSGTYWFEPLSIGATIYKIYGIQNPEELTNGYEAIDII
jgi:hypothetical protein